MGIMRRLADVGRESSLSTRLRRRRFALVREMLSTQARPARVLDVGGTPQYWLRMGVTADDGLEITVLNLRAAESDESWITGVAGDATSMPELETGAFDVVFSNSVIEHVGDLDAQRSMAAEIRRLGSRYIVQTPNRYFPIEPHFLFPFFGVLPIRVRAFLIRRVPLGWRPRVTDREGSLREARSVRLLTRREMTELFPGAEIVRERFAGLTKSFTAVGGRRPGGG